jgi:hypothetical protein
MTEIVKATASGELGSKVAYAETLARAGMLPAAYRNNPGNVLWAIEYGQALGVPPVVAISLVHVIDGKPVASAALITSLVRKAGHRLRVQASAEKARAEIVRSDDPEFVFVHEFSLADAKRAGIDRNPTWNKYPQAMLTARAITACARVACPEVLSGLLYTPEELGAEVDGSGNPVQTQRQSVRQAAGPWSEEQETEFCIATRSVGVDCLDVEGWCQSLGQPVPAMLPADRRARLLAGLQPGQAVRQRFDGWLAQQKATAVVAGQDVSADGEIALSDEVLG